MNHLHRAKTYENVAQHIFKEQVITPPSLSCVFFNIETLLQFIQIKCIYLYMSKKCVNALIRGGQPSLPWV